MDNLMITQMEFRAEEDAEVAAHTFKKHVTAQARSLSAHYGCKCCCAARANYCRATLSDVNAAWRVISMPLPGRWCIQAGR